MVWIWIIIAIIVIALIVWLLLSRRKSADGARQATVGRHVASSEKPAGTSGAASAGGAAAGGAASGGTGEEPVFDQEAHDDAATGSSGETTEAAGAAESAMDESAAAESAAAEPSTAEPSAAEPVVHNTGSTGAEEVVASGSVAADEGAAERAATDAEVAAANDDPHARPAGALPESPSESPAEAARHEDEQFAHTPVEERPDEGEVPLDEGAPSDATEEEPDLGRPSDAGDTSNEPAADEAFADDPGDAPEEPATDTATTGEVSTGDLPSAGQTAGYAVGRSDSAAGAADDSGVDPMTERFGIGAVSPRSDGSEPEGHPIKGNADSMLFHTPDSPRYDATDPAVWFTDEAAATSAGFAHWDRTKRGGAIPAPANEPADTPAPADEPADTPAPADEPADTPAPEDQRATASSPSDGDNAPSVGEEAVTGGERADDGRPVGSIQAEPDPMTEQFGEGAASPREDGSAPTERHTIKGNADSMLFHTPDSPHYERSEAEVWFTDEESAKAAGFQHWDHRQR